MGRDLGCCVSVTWMQWETEWAAAFQRIGTTGNNHNDLAAYHEEDRQRPAHQPFPLKGLAPVKALAASAAVDCLVEEQVERGEAVRHDVRAVVRDPLPARAISSQLPWMDRFHGMNGPGRSEEPII